MFISPRRTVSVGLIVVTLGVAAACGSSSSGGSNSTVKTGSSGVDEAAAALVPAAIKRKGVLNVASDASYAPDEFLAPNGTTVIGMDVDLIKAIAAKLGLKANVKNVTFNAIIPAIADGRYDLGISSSTDTKVREKTVNFVTYFVAGTSFFERSSGGPKITGLSSLCGQKVAVEAGTTEESDAKAQSKKCTNAGKPAVNVLPFATQSQANVALSAGRADVATADTPIADYQVKQSNGTFKIVGPAYGTGPYGIAIAKNLGSLDQAILAALKDLMADGTYKRILDKWGLQGGAISNPVINGAIS
jgi:polar amino acid transport system substrate-binding protein